MARETFHFLDDDLLLWMDGEAPAHQAAAINRHLKECWTCRTRVSQLEQAVADFVGTYRSSLKAGMPPVDGPKALLKARLEGSNAESRVAHFGWTHQMVAAVAAAVLLLTISIAIKFGGSSRDASIAAIPNVRLTPGSTSRVTAHDVCSGNLPTNDPAVPDPLKQQVLKEYGLQNVSTASYEIDYLVTPQLGGAANIRNLWPEPSLKTTWNARVKDELEDRLHSLVCSGKVDLGTAQRELSQNWVAAYKKYFGTNEPKQISKLEPYYFDGTSRIRCSVASSTAFREYGRG